MSKSLAGCRILVIEDEYFIAMELDALLRSHGAEVIGPLGNVDRALAQVKNDGFELAVVDINLEGVACYQCADELKRQGIPFVFASGYDMRSVPARFATTRLWQKPFNDHALVEDLGHLRQKRMPLINSCAR